MASNLEVFEAFARGEEADGLNVRVKRVRSSDLFVLYSYNTPIAYRTTGDSPMFVDQRKYSVTTSKQLGQAMNVWPTFQIVFIKHEAFRDNLRKAGADLSLAR